MRGICACMVAIAHFQTRGHITTSNAALHAFLFVDFFFVLSGFVIAASYRERLAGGFPIGSFMALRLGRVYPLHLFMLALFVLFELAFSLAGGAAGHRVPFQGDYSLEGLVASLFLVQIFFIDHGAWNMPSWSIAAEVWTYLTFALVFQIVPRRVAAVAAIIAVGAFATLALTSGTIFVSHLLAFPRCLYGFGLGVIAQMVVARRADAAHAGTSKAGTVAELAVMLAVAGFIQFVGIDAPSLAGPPLFMLTVIVLSGERGIVSIVLRKPAFQFLGLLSYSIYMVHWLVIYRFTNAIVLADRLTHGRFHLVRSQGTSYQVDGGAMFSDAMTIAMLALVIGFGWLTWRFVEKPGQQWSRRKVAEREGRRRVARAEAVAPTF